MTAAIIETSTFFKNLNDMISSSGAISNPFYERFRAGGLQHAQIQTFVDQYYYYIRTFPQILAGLAHRVDNESTRVELAKTIVSELGDGEPGKIHFQLFEKTIAPFGITPAPIETSTKLPQTTALVEGLKRLFLEEPPAVALGGHYTIEQTGLPMIVNLYEGFRTYPESTTESMEYFYLHMLVEHEHIKWISAAVEPTLATEEGRSLVQKGASEVATLLSDFWAGIDSAL